MRYYATRTIKGFWVVKAQNRNDIYKQLPTYVKKQIIQTLVSKNMSKRDIRKVHILAVFWNVSREEIETYIKERETKLASVKQELEDFSSILSADDGSKIFVRRL